MNEIKSICVYCGSQSGTDPDHVAAANQLGALLAANNIRLVYGGGDRGIMGAVSHAVNDNDGEVLGIIPRFLISMEGERDVEEDHSALIVTDNMHERKQRMFEESDAFIAMPGGIGPLEELVEIMTWAQLGRHDKPIILLNINGFWDPLLELLDHMKQAGFLHTLEKFNPIVLEKPVDLLSALENR